MHSDFLWSELQTRYVSWERHMEKATQALLSEKKAKKVRNPFSASSSRSTQTQ